MASNTINLNGTFYTPTSISLNNVIYSSTNCKGIKLNGNVVFSFSGGGGGGGGGKTPLVPSGYAHLSIFRQSFDWIQAEIEGKGSLYFPYAGINGAIRGNVDKRYEFCWKQGDEITEQQTSCVNYIINDLSVNNIINSITTENGVDIIDTQVMKKASEYLHYYQLYNVSEDLNDFITYIDDITGNLTEDDSKNIAEQIVARYYGLGEDRRFFINSYNGLYGRIKNSNDEIISNSIAMISFDTKRLYYIAGYSVFSSPDLSDVFNNNDPRNIYLVKYYNSENETNAMLTGINDYISSEHSDINQIIIKTIEFMNPDQAISWATNFAEQHKDEPSVVISSAGDILAAFINNNNYNNNDNFKCININICPNIPNYSSYLYNIEYSNDLNENYKWNINDKDIYTPFTPNNTICYYIDLEKPNQNSLLTNSVFYNYSDSEVVDSDFLIGGINYLGGEDGSLHPDDGIFNSIVENYNADINIDGPYNKLNIQQLPQLSQ